MATGIETQIVQGLTGVAALAISAGISYLSSHAKYWLASHTSANIATAGSTAIDGLAKIAENVTNDFNDRILRDAQSNGVLTPELFNQVKKDAVRSVMDQAPQLVSLASQTVGDVPSVVTGLIAKAFNSAGISPTVPNASVPPAQTATA